MRLPTIPCCCKLGGGVKAKGKAVRGKADGESRVQGSGFRQKGGRRQRAGFPPSSLICGTTADRQESGGQAQGGRRPGWIYPNRHVGRVPDPAWVSVDQTSAETGTDAHSGMRASTSDAPT